ncbi:hypothetical protein F383_06994 [Gossypium arboreum]|uniref:Uncharacterized protein n=1 Tax=Gossypium arboreum TaxID=29729 RepID=A0A0B0PBT3_GOSAR|nr:hypothetical protein F383_06994 [Gossypium arboreum]
MCLTRLVDTPVS